MADLAKRRTPTGGVRQRTRNRGALIPERRVTSLPDAEINARIIRPNDEGAEELRRVLGLVDDLGANVTAFMREKRLQRAAEQGAAGVADFVSGTPDEERLARVAAYRSSYHRSQAAALAFTYEQEVAAGVEALFSGDTIPDLEDVEEAIELAARNLLTDPENIFEGTPRAKGALASSMAQVRGRVLAQASGMIKDRMDDDLLTTMGTNALREYIAEGEHWRANAMTPSPATTPEGTAPAPKAGPVAPAGIAGEAASELRRHGMSEVVVAGFLGNFDVESAGFNLKASGDGGTAHGIAQWRNERVTNFKRVIGVHPGKASVAQQMAFVNWEMDNPHRAGMTVEQRDRILQARTPEEAAALIDQHYERSSGEHRARRVASAQQFFGASATPIGLSDDPTFPGATGAVPSGTLPRLNFEDLMQEAMGVGIDRAKAKKTLLKSIIVGAEEVGAYRALEGLVKSNRADGTPSFNPEEIGVILDARDRIEENNRTKRDRLVRERYEANETALIDTMIQSGSLPSVSQIREYRRQDQIGVTMARSLIATVESEQQQAVTQARGAARAAQAEEDLLLDREAEGLIAIRKVGILGEDTTREADERRLRSGELGDGRAALARYRRLRAAAKEGENDTMQDPQSVHYAERIRAEFKSASSGGSGSMIARLNAQQVDLVPPMLAEFKRLRIAGKEPHEAYEGAIAWRKRALVTTPQTPKPFDASRLEELRAKRNAR